MLPPSRSNSSDKRTSPLTIWTIKKNRRWWQPLRKQEAFGIVYLLSCCCIQDSGREKFATSGVTRRNWASGVASLKSLAISIIFFFNDTATTEIYTLSLHDALPISRSSSWTSSSSIRIRRPFNTCARSEEHTSELQSRRELVCRLLLEKKKNQA